MPKLRVLSGSEILKILMSLGFHVVDQHGSHVKVKRIVEGEAQVLMIPNHKEIAKGTTRAIYAQALRFVPEAELHRHFYSE